MRTRHCDRYTGLVIIDSTDERWGGFAQAKLEVNIFHHPAWINLLAECYGYHPFIVAVCDAAGEIKAGLPMMEVNSLLTGRRWVSLPFTDHCIPLHDNVESLAQLMKGLVYLSKNNQIPKVELRWEYPAHPAIHAYSDYVLHTAELASDAESVFCRIHSMHRRNIKTAEKRGVYIQRGTSQKDLDAFYHLHLHTRRRQGTPVQPKKFFDLLRTDLLEQGLGFILLAYKDTECLAASIFLYWQQTLTYKYGASSSDSLDLRPNNLLFWTAMRWGCENGYAVFDLGRTDPANTGLRAFKTKWAAAEIPLTYSVVGVEAPQSQNARLMHIVQMLIQKSPVWVCRALGEALYRHVG